MRRLIFYFFFQGRGRHQSIFGNQDSNNVVTKNAPAVIWSILRQKCLSYWNTHARHAPWTLFIKVSIAKNSYLEFIVRYIFMFNKWFLYYFYNYGCFYFKRIFFCKIPFIMFLGRYAGPNLEYIIINLDILLMLLIPTVIAQHSTPAGIFRTRHFNTTMF